MASTFPLPQQNAGRAAEPGPEYQPFSEPTESGFIGTSPIPHSRRSSEDNPHGAILHEMPVPAQQGEQVLGFIPGNNIDNEQDYSRFETLVTATFSANHTDSFGEDPLGMMASEFVERTSPIPTRGNLLDVTALDFVCLLSSEPNPGKPNSLLDVTNLEFRPKWWRVTSCLESLSLTEPVTFGSNANSQ